MSGHLFLVGFMGAGKSTTGRIVAEQLGMPFIDLDSVIEHAEGRPVAEIFETDGEEAFRRVESAALKSLETTEPSIVACGGGIVLRDENRVALRAMGTVAYLKVTAGEAIARVGDAGTRPLLSGGSISMAQTLLSARETLYRAVSDFAVDTTGRAPGEVAAQVVAAIEAHR